MTAKEYLQQAYIIDRKIKLNIEKLEAARSALYDKTVRFDRDSSKPVSQYNGTENAILRVMDLEERLSKDIDMLTEKWQKIEKAVNAVSDEAQREILTRRYLLYQKWEVIAQEMGYTKRRIFQIHDNALKTFHLISLDFTIDSCYNVK